jgi:UDP-3-O-acyl N-acetylglucosamine deacetylase
VWLFESRKTYVIRLCCRYQRTIARLAEVQGIGFLTGADVRLRFLPASPDAGVTFVRTDLPGAPVIPACVEQVSGTQRRTTLGQLPNQVALVEHVLAALAGLRIDNCTIQLNAPEPPGLDGSAGPLVRALCRAGIVRQAGRREVWTAASTIRLFDHGATLAFYPARDELKISYLLDYGLTSPIGRQMHTETITPASFARAVADCRTFVLESEVAALRRQGLGSRTTAADLLVFGRRGPIDNRLRFANEPARHKILDLVGDLALFQRDLRGHVVAYRSGHPLNTQLARELNKQLPKRTALRHLAA